MSKKKFTFFILILLAIIGFLVWFFLLRTVPTATTDGPQQGTDLFPFGPNSSSTRPQNDQNQNGTSTIDLSNSTEEKVPRLRQLWKDPTAGMTFFPETGTTTSVRFVDRATGHIYESPVMAIGNSKISNVTIPQIHEALWASNGSELVFRYLKNSSSIQSFYANIGTSTASTTSSLEGYFLPSNIRDMAVRDRKALYFNPTLNTGSLVQGEIDGTKRIVAFNSEARDWSLSYTNQKNIFLSTRPSGSIKGFGYALDLTTGITTKIAGDILGLAGTINPSGTWAFMSAHERGRIVSASYDLTTQKTTSLSTRTLSDKCAWSTVQKSLIYCAVPVGIPSGTYPDDWYKGITSFSDKLVSIDLVTGQTEEILDPSFEATQEMDIMKITVAPKDTSVTFINKKDMSLWLLRLID
jgi:riboflavin synthase alpha subunit